MGILKKKKLKFFLKKQKLKKQKLKDIIKRKNSQKHTNKGK